MLSQGIWALTNLTRGKPAPNYQKVKKGVQLICKIIISEKTMEE